MDGFSDKLKTVLSDPESMAKITELAKNFAAKEKQDIQSSGEKPEGAPDKAVLGELMQTPAIHKALTVLSDGSRERIALLCAMRPFVKEEKKEKLDKIISTMKTLDLITSAQKLL